MSFQILLRNSFIFCFLFFASCANTGEASFDVRNTNWSGAVNSNIKDKNKNIKPDINIKLKFQKDYIAELTYGGKTYPNLSYRYHVSDRQGSIDIPKLVYADGAMTDEVWLFRVEKGNKLLQVKLFLHKDKKRGIAYLTR